MSSAFDSGNAKPASHVPQERPSEPPADAGMLDDVVDATLQSAAAGLNANADDLAAMRSVAHAHAGQPFSPEPIGVELIEVVLRRQFAAQNIPAAAITALAQRIADTLCDDPVSRGRLETLWQHLSGR